MHFPPLWQKFSHKLYWVKLKSIKLIKINKNYKNIVLLNYFLYIFFLGAYLKNHIFFAINFLYYYFLKEANLIQYSHLRYNHQNYRFALFFYLFHDYLINLSHKFISWIKTIHYIFIYASTFFKTFSLFDFLISLFSYRI